MIKVKSATDKTHASQASAGKCSTDNSKESKGSTELPLQKNGQYQQLQILDDMLYNEKLVKLSQLEDILSKVEDELRTLNLWNEDVSRIPTEKELSSQIPFCLDTIPFERWLQYALIANLRAMLEASKDDPEMMNALFSLKVCVHPAAEEYWRGQWQEHRQMLMALRKLDEFFR